MIGGQFAAEGQTVKGVTVMNTIEGKPWMSRRAHVLESPFPHSRHSPQTPTPWKIPNSYGGIPSANHPNGEGGMGFIGCKLLIVFWTGESLEESPGGATLARIGW